MQERFTELERDKTTSWCWSVLLARKEGREEKREEEEEEEEREEGKGGEEIREGEREEK